MLTLRFATVQDVAVLARLNEQLIEDEGHENPLRGQQLADRMRYWLETGYRAALGTLDGQPACYALWRPDENEGIYLRQFFVARPFRRQGVGAAALRVLREDYWKPARQVRLDVLIGNQRGHAFWRATGFTDYSVIMRMPLDPG